MESSTIATDTNGDSEVTGAAGEHGSHERSNKRTTFEKYLDRKEGRKRLRKAHKMRKQERRRQALQSSLETTTRLPKPQIVKISDSSCKTRVVLDCAYDHMMSFKDICKLAHQISNCYSINRHLPSPVQLYVTGLGSAFKHSPQSSQGTKQRQPVVPEASSAASTSKHDTPTRPPVSKSTLSRLNLVNAENWDLFLKMEDFTELFPATSIVYLCAEAADELPDAFLPPAVNNSDGKGPKFTSDDVYVIGGLVDHNAHVGFCHLQASERGYRTARLPLDRTGIQLCGRKVLSLMHVFQALAGVLGGGLDWTTSLNAAIPPRKCATSTMTPAPFYATATLNLSSSIISHSDNCNLPSPNEPM
uniref:tRNA (guanine(9)-N(1))-methyltransferase n=2 Tax=Schistocephalus solidus TaxID=70667 RepID=A0A0X3NIX3_SCHSO